jgi:hypothetical protein
MRHIVEFHSEHKSRCQGCFSRRQISIELTTDNASLGYYG